jgi:hypothetical protein
MRPVDNIPMCYLSAEDGMMSFGMAALIMANALLSKHHIDCDGYIYYIHNAYWELHTVWKIAHKNPLCLFCPLLFLFFSS